jgi:hypothetical protein
MAVEEGLAIEKKKKTSFAYYLLSMGFLFHPRTIIKKKKKTSFALTIF